VGIIPFLLFDQEDFGSFQRWEWGLVCLFVSLLGLFIRVLVIMQTPEGTSGRNVARQEASTINTTGIYSLVRHPLYLGNFLMWLGLILYTGSIEFTLFAVFFFWLYYERIMFAEEEFLRSTFGEQFETWANKTPAFFPSFNHYVPTTFQFNWKRIIQREYHGVAALIISFAYLNFLKNLLQKRQLFLDTEWKWAAIITLVMYFIIRFLVKKTHIFKS